MAGSSEAFLLCSGIAPEQLQADFNRTNSGAMCEAEIEEDEEDAGAGFVTLSLD